MWRFAGISVVAVPIVVALGIAGCARPPAVRADPGRLASADAELRQGCYDCLIAARAGYRALGAGPDRPAVAARLFEVDLVLAVREKELDLPASDAIAEARRLAAELPRALEAGRYLALVDAIHALPPGGSRHMARVAAADHPTTPTERDRLRAWLARGELRPEIRRYLELALDCRYADDAGDAPPAPDVPLLAYRAAICDPGSVMKLAEVRRCEPRFVETSLFIASAELAASALVGPGQAEAHLAEVLSRFPLSPAVHDLAGDHARLVADYPAALLRYDRALALQPSHEQAWLGRIVSLTYLGRHPEAIEAATRLLALDVDSQASAYYWRARNHHALHQLADARRDITAAKEVVPTADILGRAGMIEYDQADLDPAEADLTTAIRAGGDCTARWYLALVHRQRRHWLPAGHAFEDAMACYRDRAADTAGQLASLQARSDVDPAYHDRTVASQQASIDTDTRQQHLAALMAASYLAAGGDVVAARPLVDLAAQDPALADQVTKLRTRVDAAPRAP